jgi:parallel beta-helix repeat protein
VQRIMTKKLALVLLASLLFGVVIVQPVKSQSPETIYIKPDGSVVPSTVPIQRAGNTFTLTSDIYSPIVVELGSIILDGAGHNLQGAGNASGDALTLSSSNVVVTNICVVNWTAGIVGAQSNNTIAGNDVSSCVYGVKIYASNYTLIGNTVANNSEGIRVASSQTLIAKNNVTDNHVGLTIYYSEHTVVENNFANIETDIYCQWAGTQTIYRNNFLDNATHVHDSTRYNPADNLKAPATPVNATWDNGKEGNFWSDYNGTDANADSIGDPPYTVETPHYYNYTGEVQPQGGNFTAFVWSEGTNAQDNYPLMKPLNITYVPENLQPSATPTPSPSPPPSPSPTPNQSSSPTEQPTSTPEPQPTPPSPWELILVVFASVTLTALVITAAQKLRARRTTK